MPRRAVSENPKSPVLVWFRQDLRLKDNPALLAAADAGPVVPIFVLDDHAGERWQAGGAGRWWLHHSLASLSADLASRGAPLVIRRGRAGEIIPRLARELGANAIYCGLMHEPWARRRDAEFEQTIDGSGIRLHQHRVATLIGPDDIRTRTGGIYGVYTPFARACRAAMTPPAPVDAPERLRGVSSVATDALDTLGLLPRHPDWSGGLAETWTPGEAGAGARMKDFMQRALGAYDTGRNVPGTDATSMLSPHLHWGELSPNQVWHAAVSAGRAGSTALDVFLSELLWHEFAAYLLWHHPHMPDAPLRPDFARLTWRDDPVGLRAWRRGRTGVPIVDAGMRQLWHIGWMHNRVRMITASFLTKHLLIDWRDGEAWFWDTLVDADLAANSASWQWVAGCGTDSQPFFRVFNPVTQGEKFDPDGAYVRRWVPEVARLPDKHLHAPWLAPADILRAAGVTLGETYPRPIVDLAEGRQRALDAYRTTVRRDAA